MKLSTDEVRELAEAVTNLSYRWEPTELQRIKLGAALEMARLWLIEHGAKS